jgi:exopolysaccharide biosynthesis polyprenyl glycosylphosphotransferase
VTAQFGEGAGGSPSRGVFGNVGPGAVRAPLDGTDGTTAGGPVSVRLPVAAWQPKYRTAVILTDLLVVVATAVVAVRVTAAGEITGLMAAVLGAITTCLLVGSLVATRAWDDRMLGQGAEEFRRLGRAVLAPTVVLGLAGLALQYGNLRPWVFVVLPVVLVVLMPLRYALRKLLHSNRKQGRCMLPVLAAGSVEEAADLIRRTQRESHNGWRVAAVCTPGAVGENGTGEICGVPVVGDLDDLAERVRLGGYPVVAVVPDPEWTRRRLQQLAWDLEETSADVVVAPVLMEVTGPRLNVSPVFGLPLLRVSAPSFAGFRWVVKSVVDRAVAALGVLLLAPLMVTVALLVWLEDRGPVLYRQVRIGKDGRAFAMIKFRSMAVDAEQRLRELHARNEGAGPLFKLRVDPRVTKIGAVIRRYSLDELPQLFNVLGGSMSLVGPRPPLPAEVARYSSDAHRRLKVKPGLTGLWQVSGRSNLSWAESVRLDLRYVENWSLAMDLTILWKTLGAVFKGDGAY